jgi:hypothetical protein
MKLRTLVPGAILLALVLAIWNGGFFGFGRGNGDRGNGDASSRQAAPVSALVRTQAVTGTEPDHSTTAAHFDVLEVTIDERHYTVREMVNGEPGHRRVELAELVQLARSAPGSEDGIRVRILRRASSRVTAEMLLEDTLSEAGFDKSSLQWKYVPELERPGSADE